MTSTAAPLLITIPATEKPCTIPNALEKRLMGSPDAKSPELLAEEHAKALARSESLRKAYLDAVKDRAARETTRAAAVAARKARMNGIYVDKVQRRLDAMAAKSAARKEALDAKRLEDKERRAGLALAVMQARAEKMALMTARQQELQAAVEKASNKHAKSVAEIAEKSKAEVTHAIAVASAQKEKERAAAEAAAAALAERLEAAEARRLDKLHSPCTSPGKSKARHGFDEIGSASKAILSRVRNESKVTSEMKGVALAKQMERAAHNREVILHQTAEKAATANRHAVAVVEAQQAKANGTDEETLAIRHAHYAKMQRAEVARCLNLKFKGKEAADGSALIVVPVEKRAARLPPAALVMRLSAVPSKLLSTAAARQAAAKSRRAALTAAKALKAAESSAKRAAAVGRLAATLATKRANLLRREATATYTLGIAHGRRAFAISEAHARALAVGEKREKAEAARRLAADAAKAKCAAAADRHAARVRAVAKPGVAAVRAAAAKSRRDAAASKVATRGAVLAKRCTSAADATAARLALRIEVAKACAIRAHEPRPYCNDPAVEVPSSEA